MKVHDLNDVDAWSAYTSKGYGKGMMGILSAIADKVVEAVHLIPDNVDKGEEICMGADGTPTSQVDKIAENTVLTYIAANEVPLNVLSEEIGFVDNGAEDTLILDPIDGTRNCALGIPYYTISMAVSRTTMSGATHALIRNLATGDEYTAVKGEGAYLNGHRIHVKDYFNPDSLTLFIYMGRSADPSAFRTAKRVKASRSLGCASLEMAAVAAGRADGFMMMSEHRGHAIRVFDIAASALVLREAGGEVYDQFGKPLDMPMDLKARSNFLAASDRRVFDWVIHGESSYSPCRLHYGIFANKNVPGIADVGRRVVVALDGESYMVDTDLAALMGVPGVPLEDMDIDVAIVLGGDGTILRAAHHTSARIFGINAGGVGFLAAVELEHLEEGIGCLRRGEYTVDRRAKIAVSVDGEWVSDAVNEALIHTDSVAKIRQFRVKVDDSLLTEVKADGFMLSTATGSTSYAMSLGAPIMDPRVGDAWLLVPIAAFRYSSRPIILPTSAKVTIEATMPEKGCLLVVDGQREIPVDGGSVIELSRSPECFRLIEMDTDFYQKVREKLVTSL